MADIVGSISFVANIIALFLLLIGVVGRQGSRKVLLRHGYFSIAALVIKMVTVFAAMIPAVIPPFRIQGPPVLSFSLLATKITFGILGTAMAFICIVPWLSKPLNYTACNKTRRWMLPTFIVWTISAILGGFVYFGNIIM